MNPTAAKQNRRILMIEDNHEMRTLYQEVLTRDGYTVFVAEDGEKGWSYIQSIDPHLVLLDINLPKMNGLNVLRKMRDTKTSADIPVIIFSASAEVKNVQSALHIGVHDFSVKAMVSPKQMLVKIHSILDQRNTHATPVGYQLAIHQGKVDLQKLQEDFELNSDSKCLDCQSVLLLDLTVDPTRPNGHWFVARIVCSSCSRVY